MPRALIFLLATLAVALAGCSQKPGAANLPGSGNAGTPGGAENAPSGHHVHTPRFGGALVEVGEHFANLEFVFNAATGEVTAFVADAHNENSAKIAQAEIQLRLDKIDGKAPTGGTLANPNANIVSLKAIASTLTGDTVGNTSKFTGASEALKNAKTWDATVLALKVLGQDFKDIVFNFPKGTEED